MLKKLSGLATLSLFAGVYSSVSFAQNIIFTEIPASVAHDNLNIFSGQDLTFSQPMAVSDNGVVAFQDSDFFYRWSNEGGLVQLGLSVPNLKAADISLDGQTVLFSHEKALSGNVIVFEGLQSRTIGFHADSLSGDGSYLGGRNAATFYSPAVYDLASDTVSQVSVAGNDSRYSDVSADGSLRLSYNIDGNNPPHDVTYIEGNAASIAVGQDFGPGRIDLSGDGQTVIGRYGVCQNQSVICTRAWSMANGSMEMGHYLHRGVNHDASKAVGVGYQPKEVDWFGSTATFYYPEYGAYWSVEDGIQNIEDVLNTAGIDMTGWSDIRLSAISDNGSFVVGYGNNPDGLNRGFLIHFSSLPQCVPY